MTLERLHTSHRKTLAFGATPPLGRALSAARNDAHFREDRTTQAYDRRATGCIPPSKSP